MRRAEPWEGCEDERSGRAHLSRVAEPGDRELGRRLQEEGVAAIMSALARGRAPEAWLARQATLTTTTATLVSSGARRGIRVVVPGDAEWPAGLDDLDGTPEGSPACLWARGRLPVGPSVAVVGARASTAYGEHVALDLGAGLAEQGWCVVSGAAYGVDAAAHRGSVLGGGTAPGQEPEPGSCPGVAVLACGVDVVHPVGNAVLVEQLEGAGGGVAAELPPGVRPSKWRFLARNRLIAAMTVGTVVVEAAQRSGALRTARVAADLGRYVAAVPGPVTSGASAGTHALVRDGMATLVTGVGHVVELLGPMGTGLAESGEPFTRDEVDDVAARVLDRLRPGPRPRGVTLEGLVAATGCGFDHVSRALARLEVAGGVHRDADGWRRGAGTGPR